MLNKCLKNRKFRLDAERRNQLNAVDRKVSRELNFEMSTFEWKLIKLSKSKMKSVIVEENDQYKD
jgi:predicted transcriptional regulator